MDGRRILSPFYHWWGKKEKVVIHCRGHLNSFRGLFLKKRNPELIYIIADLRGAISDEVLYGQGGMVRNFAMNYLRNFYQGVEDQVVHKADKILCVSYAFEKFLQANYRVNNISIVPTFVDTSLFNFSRSVRELFRKKLGISNRIVLVYSGGVAPWQRVSDVIKLFVGMRQMIENLFMLFLTHEPSIIHKMLKSKIEPRDVQVIKVPHGEVPGYLCAADVGVLLREDTLTNNVAAPIKFHEYMCCGLPCILSENIGDTAQVIREIGAGIVLDSKGTVPSVSEIRGLLALNREEICKWMHQKYSSKLYFEKILRLYRTVAKGGLA